MNKILVMTCLVLASTACKHDTAESTATSGSASVDNTDEMGQVVADVLSGVTTGRNDPSKSARATPIRLPAPERGAFDRLLDLLVPPAHAASCVLAKPTACTGGVITRDFAGCKSLGLTLTGDIELRYSQPDCTFGAEGDSITRSPDFTMTGVLGRSYSVSSSPEGGQKVTKTAKGFTFSTPGVERIGKDKSGAEVFHFKAKTTEDLVVGLNLNNLVISSGTLEIDESVQGYGAVLAVESLTWEANCNCPVAGTLSGTITDAASNTRSTAITFAGCGTGSVAVNGQAKALEFASCWGW